MISPSPEELDSIFQELRAVLTHPEFQRAAEEVLNVSMEQRGQAFLTQLTPDTLAAKGVQIPDWMSISMPGSESPDTSSLTGGDATESGISESMMASSPKPPKCAGLEVHLPWGTVCVTIPSRVPPPHHYHDNGTK